MLPDWRILTARARPFWCWIRSVELSKYPEIVVIPGSQHLAGLGVGAPEEVSCQVGLLDIIGRSDPVLMHFGRWIGRTFSPVRCAAWGEKRQGGETAESLFLHGGRLWNVGRICKRPSGSPVVTVDGICFVYLRQNR